MFIMLMNEWSPLLTLNPVCLLPMKLRCRRLRNAHAVDACPAWDSTRTPTILLGCWIRWYLPWHALSLLESIVSQCVRYLSKQLAAIFQSESETNNSIKRMKCLCSVVVANPTARARNAINSCVKEAAIDWLVDASIWNDRSFCNTTMFLAKEVLIQV